MTKTNLRSICLGNILLVINLVVLGSFLPLVHLTPFITS